MRLAREKEIAVVSTPEKNTSLRWGSFLIGALVGALLTGLGLAAVVNRIDEDQGNALFKKLPQAASPSSEQITAMQAALKKRMAQAESNRAAAEAKAETAPPSEPAPDVDPALPPKIECPNPLFDFGEHENVGELKHDFIIRNSGGGVLKLEKVKPTCMCTIAQPKKTELGPGEETTLGVIFRINGRTGKQSKGIVVESNDPDQPQLRLKISGTAVSPVMFDPMYMHFSSIHDDNRHSQVLKIWTPKEDVSYTITDLDLSSLPFLTTEVKTIEEGKRYDVLVSNPEPMPVGPISGELIVKTDHPKHPITTIKIYGQVIGALECRPPEIRVRFSEDPQERMHMNLQIVGGRVKEFALTEAKPTIPGVQAVLEPHGENNYIVRLSEMPMDGSVEGAFLVLKTTIPDKPEVRIPFLVDEISRRRVLRAREATSQQPQETPAAQ